jgi:predicted MFS family arabinose efflux permease
MLSGATQFFVPAEAATIPMIVRKTQLITANSLFTTTMMGSVIFGFALGDPLINIFSLEKVHLAIIGLFVLASVSLIFVKPPALCSLAQHSEPESSKTVRGALHNFIAEMRDGIIYIRNNPMILRAMLKLALLFSAVVALCILFIAFAKEYLYDNPEVAARKFAYIITYSGVGMVLGAFAVGRFFRSTRRSSMVYGGFSVIGFCLLCLGMITTIAKSNHVFIIPAFSTQFFYFDEIHLTFRMLYTYCLVTIMGVGAAFVAIPLQALLHELIPDDKRGKILGVQFTILSTCSTLPVLIAGLGTEQVGVKPMMLMIAIPIFVIGLRGLYLRLKQPNAITANW